MKTLKFTYNWNNKLDCDCYTTIRLSNFYNINDLIFVEMKGRETEQCKIIGKIKTKIDKLTELVSLLDTGYSRMNTIGIIKKMYPGINDWDNTEIFIYTITRKFSEKMDAAAVRYANERMEELKSTEKIKAFMAEKENRINEGLPK